MDRKRFGALAVALLAICLCLALCGCQSDDTQRNSPDGYNSSEPLEEAAPPEKTPQQVLEEQLFDDTHDAFLVDTGGSRGTLLVTAERTGEWRTWVEWGGYPIRLSVWDLAEMDQPLQTIETASQVFLQAKIVDVDFDGGEDITVMTTHGVQVERYACWRWNEALGQFVQLLEYGEICSPYPNAEFQIIYGWQRASALGDGEYTLYQWVEGELICVRQISRYPVNHYDSERPWLLTVEDQVDGELTQVFRGEYPNTTDSDAVLEACAKWLDPDYHGEPLPDDGPAQIYDEFQVDTGGAWGTLLVTASLVGESETEPGCYLIRLRVRDPSNAVPPLQVIDLESPVFLQAEVADVNFDGSEDFTILYYRGVSTEGYYCWCWDETLGQFVEEPEFACISSPQIDAETQTISGWNRSTAMGDGTSTFHRWVDGELVCVRQIDVCPVYDGGDVPNICGFVLTVGDRVEGELTEVFRAEFSDGSGGFFDEQAKWEDLDYHGEDLPEGS